MLPATLQGSPPTFGLLDVPICCGGWCSLPCSPPQPRCPSHHGEGTAAGVPIEKDAGGLAGNPGLENMGGQPGGQVEITWEVSLCGWDHANLLQCTPWSLGYHSQCWAAFYSPVGKHWVGNWHWSALKCMLYKASLHTAACQTQHDIPPPGWELLGGRRALSYTGRINIRVFFYRSRAESLLPALLTAAHILIQCLMGVLHEIAFLVSAPCRGTLSAGCWSQL